MAEETAATTDADTTTTAAQTRETGDKMFTPEQQEHVNRLIQERLARVKNTTPPADYEDLKAAKAELDKLKADQLSDLEKANEARAAAERQAAEATERAQRTLTDAAIIAAAASKLADPTDAVALIDRAQIEFDSDGTPSNVADLVKALVEAKPHLASKTTTSVDQGARGGGADGQISREALKGMSPEQVNKALSEGKLADVLSGKQ